MAGTRLNVVKFKKVWNKYSKVWTVDKDEFLKEFEKHKPGLSEYESELHNYKMIRSQIAMENDFVKNGKILISNKDFKQTLDQEISHWINTIFSSLLHANVNQVFNLTMYFCGIVWPLFCKYILSDY